MFDVKIKREALRNLAQTSSKQKQEIKLVVTLLKNDPIPFKKTDVSKLKGYSNTYRIRLGNIRIVYEILWMTKQF